MGFENSYPVDMAGIKNFGLDRWRQDFFLPLAPGKYCRIYDLFFDTYGKCMPEESTDPVLYWTCIAAYKSVVTMALSYFQFLMLDQLEKTGYTRILSHDKILIADAKKQLIDQEVFSYNDVSGQSRTGLERLRLFRGNTNWENRLKAFFPGKNQDQFYIVGNAASREVQTFIEENGRIPPVYLRPALLMRGNTACSPVAKNHIAAYIDQFFTKIGEQEPDTEKLFDESAKNTMQDYFKNLAGMFCRIREKIKAYLPGTLLLTHPGNLAYRLVAGAWNAQGGQTIGFTHGNLYPYMYTPAGLVRGLNAVTQDFYVGSRGEKDQLEAVQKDFPGGIPRKYAVRTYRQSMYEEMNARFSAMGQRQKSIKRVMLVASHKMPHFSPCVPNINTFSLLHLELGLVGKLKNAGLEVIYKAHPDTAENIAGFFEPLADEVSSAPFEKVFEKADCLLFVNHFSTTFGPALMTRLPIILINHVSDELWYKDMLQLLERRCAIISPASTDDGKIEISEDQLIQAIKEAKNRDDQSIVKEYAL